MKTNPPSMLLSDHSRRFLDEHLADEVDPISATLGIVAENVISDHKRMSYGLNGFILLFAALSAVFVVVAMMTGTRLPVVLLLIGIVTSVWGIIKMAHRRSLLTARYDQPTKFLQAIPYRHREPVSVYLDFFSSGQMNIVDQTGTRIVLKGKTSCYWLLASVEHMLSGFPTLMPAPGFQHPLRVEDPLKLRTIAQRESSRELAKRTPDKGSKKRAGRYEPFVESISETDLRKRLLELRQLLGPIKWDQQQENAIRVAKQLCEAGMTWRTQTEFLKDVHAECKRKYPQAAPDREKVRRTLSINQDINHKRSLYRRFLTDQGFRSKLRAEYGPIQPSLDIDPRTDPS